MMFYLKETIKLDEIYKILNDEFYQKQYNIEFSLAKKYPNEIIECMRSYIWGFV